MSVLATPMVAEAYGSLRQTAGPFLLGGAQSGISIVALGAKP